MRKRKEKLSKEFVGQFIQYNPDTGKFIRLKTVSHNAKEGQEAGYIDSDGYVKIGIDSSYYKAHRLAWLLYYGEWPVNQVDHINHIRSDNRIVNLRDVSDAEQQKNRPIRSNNKSGHCGVCWHERDSVWEAFIRVNRKQIYLGRYNNLDAAILARKSAEDEHGFHENHGLPKLNKENNID